MVFGSEKSGLSKEDLSLCDVVTTIPMQQKYPSINLSHSVMIYAYELSNLSLPATPEEATDADATVLFATLKEELTQLVAMTSIENKPVLRQRILDRVSFLNETDSKLALQLLKAVERIEK